MDKLVFQVLNGMNVVERRQAATFNNLANVSTVGFKKSINSAVIWRDLVAKDHLDSRAFPVLKGENLVDLTPGPMMRTGGELDVFISGKGLLSVQATDGSEAYTRRGDLKLTENGVLTTGAGDLVLGDNGVITIPPAQSIQLSPDGNLSIVPMDGNAGEYVLLDRLKLVNGEKTALKIREDGLYEQINKAPLEADAAISLTLGSLEASAVSPIESMVQMIKDSREYEMHVRVIKNAKEISTSSASIMRLDA